MIPATLIFRDGSETDTTGDPGSNGREIRVVRDGVAVQFHRVGMARSRFLYVEAAEQPATLAVVKDGAS